MGPRPRAKVIRRGEPRRPTVFRLRVARRTTGSAAYQIARAGNPRAQARNAGPILGVPLLLLAVAYTGFLSDYDFNPYPGDPAACNDGMHTCENAAILRRLLLPRSHVVARTSLEKVWEYRRPG